jgi:acetyltransferase
VPFSLTLCEENAKLVCRDESPFEKRSDILDVTTRPYPHQYVSPWVVNDGRQLLIRPIRPEDEQLLARFHETLSDDSVYARYAQVLPLSQRTAHERLARLCFVDYDRQIALIALEQGASAQQIVSVARLIKVEDANDVEFAVIVSDDFQRVGLGSKLMSELVRISRDEQRSRIIGHIGAINKPMLTICQQLGFRLCEGPDSRLRLAILEL